jgi:hypothetical protein
MNTYHADLASAHPKQEQIRINYRAGRLACRCLLPPTLTTVSTSFKIDSIKFYLTLLVSYRTAWRHNVCFKTLSHDDGPSFQMSHSRHYYRLAVLQILYSIYGGDSYYASTQAHTQCLHAGHNAPAIRSNLRSNLLCRYNWEQ